MVISSSLAFKALSLDSYLEIHEHNSCPSCIYYLNSIKFKASTQIRYLLEQFFKGELKNTKLFPDYEKFTMALNETRIRS